MNDSPTTNRTNIIPKSLFVDLELSVNSFQMNTLFLRIISHPQQKKAQTMDKTILKMVIADNQVEVPKCWNAISYQSSHEMRSVY